MSALLIAIGLLVQVLAAPLAGSPRPASEVGLGTRAPVTATPSRSVAAAPEIAEHETEVGQALAAAPDSGPRPIAASRSRVADLRFGPTVGSDRLDRPPKRG